MIHRVIVRELQTNCWIYPLPKENSRLQNKDSSLPDDEKEQNCIVIDPGGDDKQILDRLNALSLRPVYIVLTHAHFDHLAALPALVSKFPQADIAIHRTEAGKLGSESLESHRTDFNASGLPFYVESLWSPLPSATILLDDGDTVGPFRVMHLPGHSPGSIVLYNKAEKILFSGDTLFRSGTGRTDLPGGSSEQMSRSVKRLFTLEDATTVYPGHGAATTIRREKLTLTNAG